MSLIEIDDPRSEPQARRGGRRIAIGVAVIAVAIAIAVPKLISAGVFGSQLRATNDGWSGYFVAADGSQDTAMVGGQVSTEVSGTITIRNAGSTTVRISGVTMSGTGFRFDHVTVGDTHVDGNTVQPGGRTLAAAAPVRLGAQHTVTLTLFLRITDCRAVAATGQMVALRTDSWRGAATVSLPVPTVVHDYGGWGVVPASRPGAISTVRYLADAVCGIDVQA